MFRSLIVDSDPLVRKALKELIDWDRFDCKVIGEAASEKEALSYLGRNKVDLLITDLQMPLMNGMEFLSQIRDEAKGDPVIIALGACSEYRYVREAFLLGASDYIVKTNMQQDYLNEVFEKVHQTLEEKETLHNLMEEARTAEVNSMKEKLILQLIQHENNSDRCFDLDHASDSLMMAWLKGFSLIEHQLLCVLVDQSYDGSFNSMPLDEKRAGQIKNTIGQTIQNHVNENIVVSVGPNEYAIILQHAKLRGHNRSRAVVAETANQIIQELMHVMNLSVTIGISPIVSHCKQWFKGYQNARSAAEMRFVQGIGKVYYPESVSSLSKRKGEQQPAYGEIVSKLEQGDKAWRKWFALYAESKRQTYCGNRQAFNQEIIAYLWELQACLFAKSINWSAISETSPFDKVGDFETMNDLFAWLLGLTVEAAERIDPGKLAAEHSPDIVKLAQRIIEREFSKPLTLSTISTRVGVSEGYLSKRFFRITGESFSFYLTKVRLTKAIQLMHGGMRIYEIGEQVGYVNQAHFSKVFKRVYGISPATYRFQFIHNAKN